MRKGTTPYFARGQWGENTSFKHSAEYLCQAYYTPIVWEQGDDYEVDVEDDDIVEIKTYFFTIHINKLTKYGDQISSYL